MSNKADSRKFFDSSESSVNLLNASNSQDLSSLESSTNSANELPFQKNKNPLFFISAGDPSGDAHAARLVETLKRRFPNARFIGYAGPKTAATVCDVRVDLTQFAVMWIGRAILNLPTYLHFLSDAEKIFRNERPDAVILVDFPGFNWKIAKKAKAAGIPTIYFMPPQIWGWGQWRVKKMRSCVDLVLSCFRFENDWFRENGCRSTLVGHPFFEESRSKKIDEAFLDSLGSSENNAPQPLFEQEFNAFKSEFETASEKTTKNVLESFSKPQNDSGVRYLTILPGSRDQEVSGNVADLIETAEKVRAAAPDVRPIFAAFREKHAETIRAELKKKRLDYPIFVGKTPELMRAATCCLAVSGSVSIELLSLCKPTVIYYRIGKFQFFALRFLKRVKYITLTNLLAIDRVEGETPFYPRGRFAKQTAPTFRERELMLFPEFIDAQNRSDDAAAFLIDWFNNPKSRNSCVVALAELKKSTDFIDSPVELAAQRIEEELCKSIETSKNSVASR